MKFFVENKIFEKLPDACFGIVMARGIDNTRTYPEIDRLLEESIALAAERFDGKRVKEEADVLPYREAFLSLGINPNKYLCSVEALFTRIAKGKGMPHINPIVDLGNAISLRYTLPMGAHDLGGEHRDICICTAQPEDTFLPFGGEAEETPEPGEVVYAVGDEVRTRRWTWRQSEHGKITSESTDVFFPIDGFMNFNRDRVLAARDELEAALKQIFHCKTQIGFVHAGQPETEL